MQQDCCVLFEPGQFTADKEHGSLKGLAEILYPLHCPVGPDERLRTIEPGDQQAALLPQLLLPLFEEARGHQQQGALHASPGQEPPEHHDGLDCLPHAHLVTKQAASRPCAGRFLDYSALMGPQANKRRRVARASSLREKGRLNRKLPTHRSLKPSSIITPVVAFGVSGDLLTAVGVPYQLEAHGLWQLKRSHILVAVLPKRLKLRAIVLLALRVLPRRRDVELLVVRNEPGRAFVPASHEHNSVTGLVRYDAVFRVHDATTVSHKADPDIEEASLH